MNTSRNGRPTLSRSHIVSSKTPRQRLRGNWTSSMRTRRTAAMKSIRSTFSRACPKTSVELLRVESLDEPQVLLTLEELRTEQNFNFFRQNKVQRQSKMKDKTLLDDEQNRLLEQNLKHEPSRTQIVVPESLCQRLLMLTHISRLASHPQQNCIFYTLSRTHCCSGRVVNISAIDCKCHYCAHSRVKPRNHFIRLEFFPATRPLAAVAIDNLGPH